MKILGIAVLLTILTFSTTGFSQISFFNPTNKPARGIYLLTEHCFYTPASFGIGWQLNKSIGINFTASVPNSKTINKDIRDCYSHPEGTHHIFYNFLNNGNSYFKIGTHFSKNNLNKFDGFSSHHIELSNKKTNYLIYNLILNCPEFGDIESFKNKNDITTLSYKYQYTTSTHYLLSISLFGAVGVSYYSYKNTYPFSKKPTNLKTEESFIKPQFDIGVTTRINLFSY